MTMALIETAAPAAAPRRWTFIAGIAIFAVIIAASLLAPLIAPHDYAAQSLMRRLQPPSAAHWLGTDHLGRDAFSRLLAGGRFAILITAATLVLSGAIGVTIGIVSARAGGLADEFFMRSVDFLISLPDVIVAIFLIAILGTGYGTLILALTLVGWTPYARLARGLAMEVSAKDYVKAAEVLGCSKHFIVFRHILPNIARPILAVAFLRFGHKLITVGGLSFIGLGVQPPQPDWAAMMAEAVPFLERAPLLTTLPGLAVFLTAISVTWIGQGLDTGAEGPR